MKYFSLLTVLFISVGSLATTSALENSNCTSKKVLSAEQLFKDKLQVKSYWLAACIPPGYACQSSGDCCGVSSCNDGFCSDHSGCTPPGGVCDSSNDCCGVSSCHDGFCDTGSGCVGEGGRCRSSGDCCGSGICPDGVCK